MISIHTQDSSNHQITVLKAFSRAISRESHALTQNPTLLWQQLYNRLQWDQEEIKQKLVPEFIQRNVPGTKPWIKLTTPFRESTSLVRTLVGHTRAVTSCAVSPNGCLIASASLDWTIRIWDAVTGVPMQTLKGHHQGVLDCAFSPDGRVIVSAGNDGYVRLW
ncbi:MAG: hypothetical protein IH585_15920, partial [Anaerolineaceae bacterium]|nr:hypothetical protein [Anaerolineaceae bacterium]